TARERIDKLLDPGSFLEMSTFVQHARNRLMDGAGTRANPARLDTGPPSASERRKTSRWIWLH
ncbi:hypothetical protein CTI14_42005, partial [Methylobacterium radiotolerans]